MMLGAVTFLVYHGTKTRIWKAMRVEEVMIGLVY